ncbi:cobyrinic acid ac-diamide synthase [Sulfolobus sp. A20]|uniref:nucleotide-binding protein n=1 Tax=Sulfolobaceae TaxID=118883 RepID=UPI000845D5D8|nr:MULTISPECIES: AAA family ATPase [unclassified Sulfolobus]AOL15459.1 cobyrinic acid ac-diamide synthase [Sulfolobus sp. A20]
MKIAITGKGGTGKTTIAGTLARILSMRGYKVIAIDADDNPNLALTLGISWDKLESSNPIPTRILARVGDRLEILMPPEEIIKNYSIRGPDNIDLLIMTKIEKAGVGCACGAHATVRELVGHIIPKENEIVIMDMEPGLENLSRATPMHSDVIFTVIEPYYKSIQTGIKIYKLASELGVKKVFAIINKVKHEEEEKLVRDILDKNGVEVLGVLPYDEAVVKADKLGMAVIDVSPNSNFVLGLQRVADQIIRMK